MYGLYGYIISFGENNNLVYGVYCIFVVAFVDRESLVTVWLNLFVYRLTRLRRHCG